MPSTRKHPLWPTGLVLAVDAGALAVFLFVMPSLRRPFEMLMLLLAALAVGTAIFARTGFVRNAAVVAASLAAAVFLMEMAEKCFAPTRRLVAPTATTTLLGEGGPYAWDMLDIRSYLAARERALAGGVPPEALAVRFAGDVFADAGAGLAVSHREAGGLRATTEGYKKLYLTGTELGYELNPDNTVRDYGADPESGQLAFDAVYTVNADGYRATRGDSRSAETYIFLGDSFTFGIFLNDDQTLPYFFSRLNGFAANVMNLGVPGWGPHQSLRALQTGRFPGTAAAPGRVRGVYYGLIDTQADRAVNPSPLDMTSPRYALENGRLVFQPRRARTGLAADLAAMMDKSRVYPVLRERLSVRWRQHDFDAKWRLTAAILAETDRICRARYGVPLTVVYWDGDPSVTKMLAAAGLDVVPVGDAFPEGEGWRRMAIQYKIFDGHPSAYGNARLAEYLFERKRRVLDAGSALRRTFRQAG